MPRFDYATGLLAEIGSDLLFAKLEPPDDVGAPTVVTAARRTWFPPDNRADEPLPCFLCSAGKRVPRPASRGKGARRPRALHGRLDPPGASRVPGCCKQQQQPRRQRSRCRFRTLWAATGPLRAVAGVVHVVRYRSTPDAAVRAVSARLLLLCLLLRSSWLAAGGGRQVGAAGVLHRRGGRAALAVPVSVAVRVPLQGLASGRSRHLGATPPGRKQPRGVGPGQLPR